jgi:hypothetical protein
MNLREIKRKVMMDRRQDNKPEIRGAEEYRKEKT